MNIGRYIKNLEVQDAPLMKQSGKPMNALRLERSLVIGGKT